MNNCEQIYFAKTCLDINLKSIFIQVSDYKKELTNIGYFVSIMIIRNTSHKANN